MNAPLRVRKLLMKLDDIRLRDPFILPFNGKYYMYGTGRPNAEDINSGREFWCYTSENLEEWSQPVCVYKADDTFWGTHNFWAPEVHAYGGKFYMLASFIGDGYNRATQALVADNPTGPFTPLKEMLTPKNWMSLDGTLFVEDGMPYLVCCHEWVQIGDGTIECIPLADDLSCAIGVPVTLFSAAECIWSEEIFHKGKRGRVTDGPFLIKEDGKITLFWSSFCKGAYNVIVSESLSGRLTGPWEHKKLLFEKDGGHGMAFPSWDGQWYFTLHQPNNAPLERPKIFRLEKNEQGFYIQQE